MPAPFSSPGLASNAFHLVWRVSLTSTSAGEFRRAIRAAGVSEVDIDDTTARRIFMVIDRDESGTVELEEMLEVLTDDVLDGDDPITKMLVLHKGANVNVRNADWRKRERYQMLSHNLICLRCPEAVASVWHESISSLITRMRAV